jgi:hypothetical protein
VLQHADVDKCSYVVRNTLSKIKNNHNHKAEISFINMGRNGFIGGCHTQSLSSVYQHRQHDMTRYCIILSTALRLVCSFGRERALFLVCGTVSLLYELPVPANPREHIFEDASFLPICCTQGFLSLDCKGSITCLSTSLYRHSSTSIGMPSLIHSGPRVTPPS